MNNSWRYYIPADGTASGAAVIKGLDENTPESMISYVAKRASLQYWCDGGFEAGPESRVEAVIISPVRNLYECVFHYEADVNCYADVLNR